MGSAGGTDTSSQARRTTTSSGYAGRGRWDFLCQQKRLPVANAAARVREMGNGVLLFQQMAQEWGLASYECGFEPTGTPGRWQTTHTQRHDSRQPKCQDDGQGGVRGYNGSKHINGRKRHLLVDTLGLVLKVIVTEANIQDRDVAQWLMWCVEDHLPRLQRVWADAGYRGTWTAWNATKSWRVEIVTRSDTISGFQILPKRWIVERTFAWLSQQRRLSKDYEYLVQASDAMCYIAMIRLMLSRLAA